MINRSVNTLEEAVKVVMEELGWDLILDEYHLEYKVGDEYDSEILSKEQALAHCKDLNVLAGIWDKFPDYEIIITKSQLIIDLYPENMEFEPAMIDLVNERLTLQEAALIATAQVLQQEKEK